MSYQTQVKVVGFSQFNEEGHGAGSNRDMPHMTSSHTESNSDKAPEERGDANSSIVLSLSPMDPHYH